MERLIQYLDDLDDLIGMIGLVAERLRNLFLTLICCVSIAAVAAPGIWLAQVNPPLALATSTILFVTLLYRAVTAAPSRALSATRLIRNA